MCWPLLQWPPLTHRLHAVQLLPSVPCQVGDLPLHAIPVHVGVVGTPLCLQREARLLPGVLLRPHPGAPSSAGPTLQPPPRAQLDVSFGAVVMREAAQRSFHVFNTSFLDVRLDWAFWRLGPAGPVLRRWAGPSFTAGCWTQGAAGQAGASMLLTESAALSLDRCLGSLPAGAVSPMLRVWSWLPGRACLPFNRTLQCRQCSHAEGAVAACETCP